MANPGVEPFEPNFPQAALDDLHERLARSRFPDALPGTGWEYGADAAWMRRLRDHWLHRFDWRAQERAMGRFRHFRVRLGDASIHFVHERGEGPRPLPLLLSHGWPGSFLEFTKLIPLLTHPGRFGAQGGDLGAGVSTALGWKHPECIVGIHLNYVPASFEPPGQPTPAEAAWLASVQAWQQAEGAYAHVQRTEPQTLAMALNDSPLGLAAWIVTRFRAWSDCDGDVLRRFSLDELLTNVTLYWLTETAASSFRRYFDGSRAPLRLGPGERIGVPCGFARFPRELPFPPRERVERGYEVRRWTEMPRGGHFAAMEEPALLADDLRAFFRPLRG